LSNVAGHKRQDFDSHKLGVWARRWKNRIAGGLSLRETGSKDHQAVQWKVVA
jgi:hypothetical protein